MSYIFSRSTSSVNPDYAGIAQSGATIALNAEDPNLPQAIADARASGARVAIWIPAHTEQDPQQYGERMASLVQYYKPDAILPNIETQGEGDSGATWSQQMMQTYAKYVPPGMGPRLDVTVEGNKPQGMFNYQPYLNYGGGVVVESFWGNMQQRNPEQMRQVLLDSGIPPDKINVLLAPGQTAPSGGNYSTYTWDDMTPEQQKSFLTNYANAVSTGKVQAPPAGLTPATTTPQNQQWTNYARPQAAPPQPGPQPSPQMGSTRPNPQIPQTPGPIGGANQYNQIPDTTPRFTQLTDATDPAAQAYARSRLAQHGITVKKGEDAAAMWRQYSGQLAAARATALAQGPDAPGEGVVAVGKIPASLPQNVAQAARLRALQNAGVTNSPQTPQVQPLPTPPPPPAPAAAPSALTSWIRYGTRPGVQ